MTDYRTSSGVAYSFSGWNAGESPLECWDRQDWLKCLHGCMLCLNLLNDRGASHRGIEDDGILHELVHLALGVETCHHHDRGYLRASVNVLQTMFDAKIESFNTLEVYPE